MNNKFYETTQTVELILHSLDIYKYFFDDKVTEIDINPDTKIFIQKLGEGSVFVGNAEASKTKNLIQALASLEDKVINREFPRISTLLPLLFINKSGEEELMQCRFEGNVPPVVEGPSCTIRKKIIKILSLDDYINQGIIGENEKKLLEKYVIEKKNILISVATNTGKTTFINALIKVIDKHERLGFIEDVRELQSEGENNIFMLTIPKVFEPKDALKSMMRYSIDRVIYGEVRGSEAFDLLNILNTGHSGFCSVHANDARSALDKLETLILYERNNPLSQVISRTFGVVVTMVMENYKRKLDSIVEIKGYKDGEYILDFKFRREVQNE